MEVDAAPGAVKADALVVSDGEGKDERAGTGVATTTTANSARGGIGGTRGKRKHIGGLRGGDARLPEWPMRS